MYDPKKDFEEYDKTPINYFKISEFRNICPDHNLLLILNLLREAIGVPICIQDCSGSAITLQGLVNIYKAHHYDWTQFIPWESRHLAIHATPYLRAVDIYAFNDSKNLISGDVLKNTVVDICPQNLFLGLGVFQLGLHIDVGRENFHRVWRY